MAFLYAFAVESIPFIALANFLWGMLLILMLARRQRLPWDPPFTALAAYGMATVASGIASLHPLQALSAGGDILNFLVFPLSAFWVRKLDDTFLKILFIIMALFLETCGVVQHFLHPSIRIRGPLSHYMTYSGILLILIFVNLATTIKSRHRGLRIAALGATLFGLYPLFLTLTRNAWLGLVVGLILVAIILKRLWPWAFLLLFFALFLLPGPQRSRLGSLFDLSNPSNNDRLAMAVAGWEMVKDYPLFGVGPDQVKRLYPFYRQSWATRLCVPHLHNNIMQIAAERGIFALIAYLWFLVVLFREAWRRRERWGGLAALCAMGAITVAGVFEWNFGDTEVLMLTLVTATLVYASDRSDKSDESDESDESDRGQTSG